MPHPSDASEGLKSWQARFFARKYQSATGADQQQNASGNDLESQEGDNRYYGTGAPEGMLAAGRPRTALFGQDGLEQLHIRYPCRPAEAQVSALEVSSATQLRCIERALPTAQEKDQGPCMLAVRDPAGH